MKFKFSKMQALGNDFVVLDHTREKIILNTTLIQKLCDRHFGIGCDQLLILEKIDHGADDFLMRIFNADGNEVYQCGNGMRCITRYIHENYLPNTKKFSVSTARKKYQVAIQNDGLIAVNMDKPIFEPKDIPFHAEIENKQYVVKSDVGEFTASVLSVGNPHCVIQVDEIEHVAMNITGRALSKAPCFPEAANVEFMQIVNPELIKLRIYERGVGETLACGSGACASVAAGHHLGLLSDQVRVIMAGGELQIKMQNNEVWMLGPADYVFEGEIKI
jgi:diaminopimelate epimerase